MPAKPNDPDAAWFLIATGEQLADGDRFAHDLALAYHSLVAYGVSAQKIVCLAEGSPTRTAVSTLGVPSGQVFDWTQAASVFAGASTSGFVGVLVSGHGSGRGIGSNRAPAPPDPGQPMGLLAAARSVQGATDVALILGQCHAGVFRYVDARGTIPATIMGAVNLGFSISGAIRVEQVFPSAGPVTWAANLFLAAFCEWLRHPADIDGDGHATLLDAYRKSGVDLQLRVSGTRLESGVDFQKQVLEPAAKLQQPDLDPADALVCRQLIWQHMAVMTSAQDAWIMHPDHARTLGT